MTTPSSPSRENKIKSFFRDMYKNLLPVNKGEYSKLLMLAVIIFLVCFNYSILRNAKDTVVVLAKGSGAKVIPCIKMIALLPGAILATWIYTKLASRFRRETVFHIIVTGFVAFFLFFTFFLCKREKFS